jgi:hypothetical protein
MYAQYADNMCCKKKNENAQVLCAYMLKGRPCEGFLKHMRLPTYFEALTLEHMPHAHAL